MIIYMSNNPDSKVDPTNEVRFRLAIKALREAGAWFLADQMERALEDETEEDEKAAA